MPPQPPPKCHPCAISGSTTRPCPKGAGRGASFARECRPARPTESRSAPPAGQKCAGGPSANPGAARDPKDSTGHPSNQWDMFFGSCPNSIHNPVIKPSYLDAGLVHCHTPSKEYPQRVLRRDNCKCIFWRLGSFSTSCVDNASTLSKGQVESDILRLLGVLDAITDLPFESSFKCPHALDLSGWGSHGVPGGALLVGMGQPEHHLLSAGRPGDLKAHRQPPSAEPAGDGNGWRAR